MDKRKLNKLTVELLDPTGVVFDKYSFSYPANDPEEPRRFRALLGFNDQEYYYVKEDGKELEKVASVKEPDPVIPIRWITRQWIQKVLDTEKETSIDLLQMELNHMVKMYEYQKNNIK
jgi:hypothetical protein